ncbi:MAG TPA: zf-HC2 domain-containing protein [Steroidobacteraceae bacterium]|jgi:hypothetical protein|nr:zf-HC2 domain-containing protein [Steroidobacteraceae bacterium]
MTDHMRFKANLTAATYVAHALDESAQEDFELHLMSCPECVDDVEAWRAIEKHMPRDVPAAGVARSATPHPALNYWRLAASVIGVGILGAAAGWYGRALTDSELDRTAFFNAAPVTRGDCMPLRLAADTQRIALRVPGVASDRRVVARYPGAEEIGARGYSARRQSDGSWLLQFTAAMLARHSINLESAGDSGPAEPLGCVSAAPAP